MKSNVLTTGLFALALTASACAMDDSDGALGASVAGQSLFYDGEFEEAAVNGNMDVLFAGLAGEVGGMTGLRDVATEVSAYDWDGYQSLTITVQTDRGSAMAIIDLYDGVDASDAGEPVDATVVGCSGPDGPGYWDYDASAEEFEIEVVRDDENPEVVWVSFEATFSAAAESAGLPRVLRGTIAINPSSVVEVANDYMYGDDYMYGGAGS